jgi:hypothetical protein
LLSCLLDLEVLFFVFVFDGRLFFLFDRSSCGFLGFFGSSFFVTVTIAVTTIHGKCFDFVIIIRTQLVQGRARRWCDTDSTRGTTLNKTAGANAFVEVLFAKRAGCDLVIAKTGECTFAAGNRLDESQIATDTSDLAVLVWVLVLVAGQTTSEFIGGKREAAVVADATAC